MKLISVNQYAEMTASAPSTIRALCQKGKIPAFKLGSNWKIDLDKATQMANEAIEDNMQFPTHKEQVKIKPEYRGDFKQRLKEFQQRVYDRVKAGQYKCKVVKAQ